MIVDEFFPFHHHLQISGLPLWKMEVKLLSHTSSPYTLLSSRPGSELPADSGEREAFEEEEAADAQGQWEAENGED